MKFTIFNRRNIKDSKFTDSLMAIFATKGDTLVLGYGYIKENIFGYYNKSDEFIESSICERFRRNINYGFEGVTNPKIIIIGCKGKQEEFEKDKKEYKSFTSKLKKIIDNKNVEIKLYLDKCHDYHTKIAFKKDSKTLKILLTGSSNLTRNTLNIRNGKFFNRETDILFWDNNELKIENKILNYINEKIIVTDKEDNKYIDEIKKILGIDDDTIKKLNLDSRSISPMEVYNLSYRTIEEIKEFEEII